MRSIASFGLTKSDGSIINYSHLAKLAFQIANKRSNTDLSRRITELAYAHYNSKEYYLKAYVKLANSLINLQNKTNAEIPQLLPEVERAALCFLITSKNSLDILICIMDILEFSVIRREEHLPDLFTTNGRRSYSSSNVSVNNLINDLRNFPWVILLHDFRNKVLHRGYSIKIDNDNQTPNIYSVYIIQKELQIAIPETPVRSDFVLGVELIEKTLLDVEQIMLGLTHDLPNLEESLANVFIDDNLVNLDPSQISNWLIPPTILIKNY